MLLYTHAVWGFVLGDFFGPGGWLSERLVHALQDGSYTYSFWWLVPGRWIWTAYGLSMVVLALFLRDLRAGIVVPGTAFVERVASYLASHGDRLRGSRIAFLSSDPATYGMTRMLEILSSARGLPLEVRTFQSVEAAEHWLRSAA
jgi:hypothetical protein